LQTTYHLYKLGKKERLTSDKKIEQLFKQGINKTYGCLRMVCQYIDEEELSAVMVMFSAPKKNFKSAVKRNLIKRRMREAYRINKNDLLIKLTENKMKVLLAFLFIDSEVKPYSDIEKCMKYLMNSLLSKTKTRHY